MFDIPQTKDWEGFFQTLRLFPMLWDRNLAMRSSKSNNNVMGLRRLLRSYQKISPVATLNTLQRCLMSIRLCFGREVRREVASKKSSSKDLYEPTLWYYRHLIIVRDQVRRTRKKPKKKIKQEAPRATTLIRSCKSQVPPRGGGGGAGGGAGAITALLVLALVC